MEDPIHDDAFSITGFTPQVHTGMIFFVAQQLERLGGTIEMNSPSVHKTLYRRYDDGKG